MLQRLMRFNLMESWASRDDVIYANEKDCADGFRPKWINGSVCNQAGRNSAEDRFRGGAYANDMQMICK